MDEGPREKPRIGQLAKATTNAWAGEPPLTEERSRWYPDAPPWRRWNGMSPEYEFCEFVGALVALVKPALVIETGVGQGFTTRRIAAALAPGAKLIGYESDDAWREQLASLSFFDGAGKALADVPTPADEDVAAADLFVADSDNELRVEEVRRWSAHAKPGAFIAIHDTGHGHPDWTPHHRLGELVSSLGLTGVRLPTPRGSFLGQR